MLFQVSALIVRSFVQIEMVEIGFGSAAASHLSALVGFAVFSLLIWPVFQRVRPSLRAQFRQPESWTRMVLACIALGVLIWLGQLLILLALTPLGWDDPGWFTNATYPTFFVACGEPANLLLAMPVMVIVTPLFEEVINRGVIFQTLLRNGEKLAICLSAILFAILHRPGAMPFAFAFGLIAAIQLLRYCTLWAVVITHGTVNLLVEFDRNCLEGFWMPGKTTSYYASTLPLMVMFLVVCAVGSWWLAARCRAGAAVNSNRPGACDQR
jgi:membrane protease YdiL (CAAX protease family)